jgi:hypothetical protein
MIFENPFLSFSIGRERGDEKVIIKKHDGFRKGKHNSCQSERAT